MPPLSHALSYVNNARKNAAVFVLTAVMAFLTVVCWALKEWGLCDCSMVHHNTLKPGS